MSKPNHSEILRAGLDPGFPGEMFPTLVFESESDIKIQVLDPQPVYGEASRLCHQWLDAVIAPFGEKSIWTLAYLTSPTSVHVECSDGR